MAKRIITWREEKGVLEAGEWVKANEDGTPGIVEFVEEFDLNLLFEVCGPEGELVEFSSFNKVQKHLAVYGVKQKLADAGSSEKTFAGKMRKAKELWWRFLSGEFAVKRTGGGAVAAENKRIADAVKKGMEGVSMQSLILKQMTNPEGFTEEDRQKLDEFILMAAEHVEKQE